MQSETPVEEWTGCLQEVQRQKETEDKCRDRRRQKETEVMQSETPVEEWTGCLQEVQRQKETEDKCRDRRRQKTEVMQSETPVEECTVCLQEVQRQKETEDRSDAEWNTCEGVKHLWRSVQCVYKRCRDRRRQKTEVMQSETPVEEWTGCLQEVQRQKETEDK
ncbi:hypothetical protein Bbelb_343100 [Branchiostoma belcheri]|nr:hypothetical protein Bbelb_343100 [Branchiostoma belcheri]